jgi:hypothetical protein
MTVSRNQYEVKLSLAGDFPSPQFYGLKAHKIGGQGRNRTGVDGFAGRSMTTLPPGLGVEFPGKLPERRYSTIGKLILLCVR